MRQGEAGHARECLETAQRAQAVVAEEELGGPGGDAGGHALERGDVLADLGVCLFVCGLRC